MKRIERRLDNNLQRVKLQKEKERNKLFFRSSMDSIRSNMLDLQYEKFGEKCPLTKKKIKHWIVCLERSLWVYFRTDQTNVYDE